jgi:hypothetical protein
VPSPSQPWDARRAAHLLRRATFLPTWADIKTALTQQPGDAVDALLDVAPDPPSPGSWVTQIFDKPTTQQELSDYKSRNDSLMNALNACWVELMVASGMNVTEKMTLFWHGHITGEGGIVLIPQYMYQQNALPHRLAARRSHELRRDFQSAPPRHGQQNLPGRHHRRALLARRPLRSRRRGGRHLQGSIRRDLHLPQALPRLRL